ERRIADYHPAIENYLRTTRPLWPALREILSLPHCAMALRGMQDTRLLRLILPEWEGIECLVTRDFYHRYTVDEHTIVAMECLQDLARSSAAAHRRFVNLLSELDEPAILRFALLFHDIGKGARSGQHAQVSAAMAVEAMERLGIPEKHRQMVLF